MQVTDTGNMIDVQHEHLVLANKLDQKTAQVGVIGLGYVGLPLAMEYASQGFFTLGVDLDKEKVLRLNAGNNYIQDVPDEQLERVLEAEKFRAEDDFATIGEADIIYICVPTPVTEHKDPDTSYIRSAAESIAARLRSGQLIILKSTTYPDTTEGLVQPILEAEAEKRGLLLGRDYFLAFSPERIDPGNKNFNTANTPVVVGGVTEACTELACLAMQKVIKHVHPVSSPKVAEMEKLVENIFRSVNIAFVNELARLCDRMGGVSVWEVIEAASTKPFGFMPFQPGPGLGGHCIPIDPYYLSWLARRYDFETNFITLSARTNEEMPYYVVDAVLRAIAEQPISLGQAKVLMLGVAFKRDVDDTRHSPALTVMQLLWDKGIENIQYSDPFVERLTVRKSGKKEEITSVALTEDVIRDHDVVVLMTDHKAFPYSRIASGAHTIIDTRNAFRHIKHNREKIRLLGGGSF